jgi:hypothetical protein
VPGPTKDLRVGILVAVWCPIALEIVQHRRRFFSDVTKVYGLAALAKEEKFVKQLEKLSRRLVNADED